MRSLKIEEVFVGMWVCRHDEPYLVKCITHEKLMLESLVGKTSEVRLRDVQPLDINENVLSSFGFVEDTGRKVWIKKIGDIRLIVGLKQVYGNVQCRRVSFGGGLVSGWNEEIRYVHELQRWWVDKVLLPYGAELKLEWYGKE